MKLTKAQIKYIDNYLKNKGIVFWDVRLEMVDHLVSDMESYEDSADFDSRFKQSLINANWPNTLKKVNQEHHKATNKIYRAKLWKEMLYILKTPLYLISLIVVYFALRKIALYDVDVFKFTFVAICCFILVTMIIEIIRIKVKKIGKSINLQYGSFYFSFGSLMINLPIYLMPKDSQFLWFPLIICFYILMTTAGYRVYRTALKKVLKMKHASY